MDPNELTQVHQRQQAAARPCVIRCCTAAGCQSAGSSGLLRRLRQAVVDAGRQEQIEVRSVGCLRLCSQGPLVQLDPSGQMYQKVQEDQAPSLVAAALGGTADAQPCDTQAPFFRLQSSVVLANSGRIDPEDVEHYIAADGYAALAQVLTQMQPEEVVETVIRSGLRGRGGAGYPTGVKWSTVARAKAERKFVVCNADEGDPGAFMNRSVLESDPHSVLEGMAIAAYAVGASQGYIYIRGEYPLATQRLETALKQAGRLRLLGSHIFNTAFDFRIDIRVGAGAFVCGEETALMASIMGERGLPRPRPPYPAERGLWGYPTLINNVETFANIPAIIRRGADWFASLGTPKNTGTKVFSLTGKVRNVGLVEVPLGTPLRTIVETIGGGAPSGRIKAVQTGGPSGGCVPAELLDTPVDYESLAAIGSIMGSGGLIVMDEQTNMVDVARFFMAFCQEESCGKCIPCRAGTVQLHRLLTRFVERRATRRDLELLFSLCGMVKETSLCGLGQTAPNPVLSTLRYFRHEYEALLQEG